MGTHTEARRRQESCAGHTTSTCTHRSEGDVQYSKQPATSSMSQSASGLGFPVFTASALYTTPNASCERCERRRGGGREGEREGSVHR
jgi:hypothetical protein